MLLYANYYRVDENTLCDEARFYDTDGSSELPDGEYVQMIFLGDKQIPFTEYREYTRDNVNRYVKNVGGIFEFQVGVDAACAASDLYDAVRRALAWEDRVKKLGSGTEPWAGIVAAMRSAVSKAELGGGE